MTITKKAFQQAMKECETYSEVAVRFGVHLKTVVVWARKFNMQRLGPKKGRTLEFDLNEILNGQHPQYPTYLLKKRLLKEGLLEYKCVKCGISDWNGKPLTLELDHEDGNRYNHQRDNVQLVCPNCHSQTSTYKSKNKLNKRLQRKIAREV